MEDRLSPLQRRVLDLLRGMHPPWVLTGGAALAGFHLGHRTTRDLDLFFRDQVTLDEVPREVEARLRNAGLDVRTAQAATAFRRLEVRDGSEVIEVDLVADPVGALEPPVAVEPGLLVDTRHEILVNKLTALLSRVAVRDLVDLRALVMSGGDLERALADASKKDGGFSPPTLAWLLQGFPVEKLARDAGFEPEGLVAWRDELVDRLLG